VFSQPTHVLVVYNCERIAEAIDGHLLVQVQFDVVCHLEFQNAVDGAPVKNILQLLVGLNQQLAEVDPYAAVSLLGTKHDL